MAISTQTHPDILLPFAEMATRLTTITSNRPVVFLVNPGNWGDSLIRTGAEAFFRTFKINYRTVRLRDLESGKINATKITGDPVLIVNGSGGYIPNYDLMGRVNTAISGFSDVIFLPSTFVSRFPDGPSDQNREFYSRDLAESLRAQPGSLFCHDMAFFLGASSWRGGKGTGYLFRQDSEKPDASILPVGNVDISAMGRTNKSASGFFRYLARFETILTDRLHVAIGGALLGRQVHLYANSYFKNRAIFQASLEPYFPLVTFHDHPFDGKGAI